MKSYYVKQCLFNCTHGTLVCLACPILHLGLPLQCICHSLELFEFWSNRRVCINSRQQFDSPFKTPTPMIPCERMPGMLVGPLGKLHGCAFVGRLGFDQPNLPFNADFKRLTRIIVLRLNSEHCQTMLKQRCPEIALVYLILGQRMHVI